jgi:hypothetical protein
MNDGEDGQDRWDRTGGQDRRDTTGQPEETVRIQRTELSEHDSKERAGRTEQRRWNNCGKVVRIWHLGQNH